MLVLDHLHQRIHNNLPDETTLHNGQKFDLLGLGLLGVPQLSDHFNELQNKLQELKFDVGDYICMKFLLLLNPGKLLVQTKIKLHISLSCLAEWWNLNLIFVLFSVFLFIRDESYPEVRGITNRKTVEEGYGNVQAALLDYTLTCYPSVTVSLRVFFELPPFIIRNKYFIFAVEAYKLVDIFFSFENICRTLTK